jgi:hypothetical protein
VAANDTAVGNIGKDVLVNIERVIGTVGNDRFILTDAAQIVMGGQGTDTVVTKVMYDLDADTMTLRFKPIRHLTQEECDMVDAAQADPETQKYVALTVAQADGVKERPAPEAPAPKAMIAPPPTAKPANPFTDDEDEDEDEAPAQPVKRTAKKETATTTKKPLAAVLNAWGEED